MCLVDKKEKGEWLASSAMVRERIFSHSEKDPFSASSAASSEHKL